PPARSPATRCRAADFRGRSPRRPRMSGTHQRPGPDPRPPRRPLELPVIMAAGGSMARWHLSCDHCEASAWIGARGDERDAWCEACQTPADAGALSDPATCARCGAPLTTHELCFEELYGQLQHLAAVLGAWK